MTGYVLEKLRILQTGAKVQGFTQEEGHLFVDLHQVRDDHLVVVPMGLGAEHLCSLS